MRMESEAAPFSAADLRTRMARMGTGEDETTRYGDHLLNPDLVQLAEHAEARDAAVLVPVVVK